MSVISLECEGWCPQNQMGIVTLTGIKPESTNLMVGCCVEGQTLKPVHSEICPRHCTLLGVKAAFVLVLRALGSWEHNSSAALCGEKKPAEQKTLLRLPRVGRD